MNGSPGLAAALLVPLLAASCDDARMAPATLQMSKTFLTTVDLNGHAATVLLDTGSEVTLLAAAVTARFGLPVRELDGRALILTDSTGARREHLNHAAVEGIGIGDHRFLVGNLPVVPLDGRLRCDGILGMDIMQHAAWWFDAPAGELHMCDPQCAEEFITTHAHRVAARLALTGSPRRPLVAVELSPGHVVELLVDSGASRTTLPAASLALLDLGPGEELDAKQRREAAARSAAELSGAGLGPVAIDVPADDGSRVGVRGDTTGPRRLYHLPRLVLGGRAFENLVVAEQTGGDPLLGRDVLDRCPWLLHGPARQLWLLARR